MADDAEVKADISETTCEEILELLNEALDQGKAGRRIRISNPRDETTIVVDVVMRDALYVDSQGVERSSHHRAVNGTPPPSKV